MSHSEIEPRDVHDVLPTAGGQVLLLTRRINRELEVQFYRSDLCRNTDATTTNDTTCFDVVKLAESAPGFRTPRHDPKIH